MSRSAEMQPGRRQALYITYDNLQIPAFSDYVTSHRAELMQRAIGMPSNDCARENRRHTYFV